MIGVHRTAALIIGLLVLVLTNSSRAQNLAGDAHLYFFTNHGCAPCRQVEPEIESLRNAGYPVTTVYLDEHPNWAEKFSVDRTPTVIMVANQRIVGRHAGLIDAATLQRWFQAVSPGPNRATPMGPSQKGANQKGSAASGRSQVEAATGMDLGRNGKFGRNDGTMLATYAELPPSAAPDGERAAKGPSAGSAFGGTRTLHAGTSQPATEAERQAMNATVRLKVQDSEGVSYATGTVIHSHAGEWLVMTCGHAFREAGLSGKITAEFDFLSGQIQSADGELISFDAESRDVALVAVHAGREIQPVKLADADLNIERGLTVFTIGCDGGSNPTIRHTEIKNKAVYAPANSGNQSSPGAIKYDIYGRPAIGRSGGGMFNEAGELIGVCNAAAVESDEGIYSALDSLHWQIAHSNLSHLFEPSEASIAASSNPVSSSNADESLDNRVSQHDSAAGTDPVRTEQGNRETGMQPVSKFAQGPSSSELGGITRSEGASSKMEDSDTEVIIIVRSKSSPQLGESITISNPTPQLIQYLGEMKAGSESRQLDLARVRHGRLNTNPSGQHLR